MGTIAKGESTISGEVNMDDTELNKAKRKLAYIENELANTKERARKWQAENAALGADNIRLKEENRQLRELDSDPIKVLSILIENGTLREVVDVLKAELGRAEPLLKRIMETPLVIKVGGWDGFEDSELIVWDALDYRHSVLAAKETGEK